MPWERRDGEKCKIFILVNPHRIVSCCFLKLHRGFSKFLRNKNNQIVTDQAVNTVPLETSQHLCHDVFVVTMRTDKHCTNH